MSVAWRRADGDALVLTLHVQPGAARTEVAGTHGDALKVRLAAPPVDGKANAALVRYLADAFAVPLRDVTLAARRDLAAARRCASPRLPHGPTSRGNARVHPPRDRPGRAGAGSGEDGVAGERVGEPHEVGDRQRLAARGGIDAGTLDGRCSRRVRPAHCAASCAAGRTRPRPRGRTAARRATRGGPRAAGRGARPPTRPSARAGRRRPAPGRGAPPRTGPAASRSAARSRRLPGAALMRATTSFCSITCMSRTCASYCARWNSSGELMLYGRLPTMRRSAPSVAKSKSSASASCSVSAAGAKRSRSRAARSRSISIAVDVAGARDQRFGERREPGADLDDVVAGLRARRRRRCARCSAGRRGSSGRTACARVCPLMPRGARPARWRARPPPPGCPGRRSPRASAIGGEVERRAVVDRRARERQAERHVDAVAEARRLEHRQALVVVHRDDRVVVARVLRHEHGVGRQRPVRTSRCRRARDLGDGRRDHVDLLAPEVAALARVRIEAAHARCAARRCRMRGAGRCATMRERLAHRRRA